MILPLLSLIATEFIPPPDQVVIYEENLRAEGAAEAFRSVTGRLDSIKRLGANVIWLMPVQPVGKIRSAGGLGSPYAVADYDALNPEFGTEADFRHLVSSAHSRGIAVILDWVGNHTAWDSPWIKHPEWYTRDEKGQIMIPAGTNWQDVADLDFSNREMRAAMIASMKGWVTRYGIDGFRCDAADFVPADFWKEAVPALRKSTPKRLLMLAEGFRADHYDAGFDLTYGWNLYYRLKEIYKGSPATAIKSAFETEAKDIPAHARRLRFSSNHDEAAWEGAPAEIFKGPGATDAAFGVVVLSGGTPLIYMGQEVGWEKRIPLFDHSTIDWTSRPDVRKRTEQIFALRRGHPALSSGSVEDFSQTDAIAYGRTSGKDRVLVVANVRDHAVTLTIPAKWQGRYRDPLTKEAIQVDGTLTLPAFAWHPLVLR